MNIAVVVTWLDGTVMADWPAVEFSNELNALDYLALHFRDCPRSALEAALKHGHLSANSTHMSGTYITHATITR